MDKNAFWRKCREVGDLFLDESGEDPREPHYDPLHLGAMVVLCLMGIGVLYWLLWALLVCEGGLFIKVVPFLWVVFTSKTLADYGWEGYPYALGVFEGFIVNLGALVLLVLLLVGIAYLFRGLEGKSDGA